MADPSLRRSLQSAHARHRSLAAHPSSGSWRSVIPASLLGLRVAVGQANAHDFLAPLVTGRELAARSARRVEEVEPGRDVLMDVGEDRLVARTSLDLPRPPVGGQCQLV